MGAALLKTRKRPQMGSNLDSHSNVCGYSITIQPQPRMGLNLGYVIRYFLSKSILCSLNSVINSSLKESFL
jgi:hypothetical protein